MYEIVISLHEHDCTRIINVMLISLYLTLLGACVNDDSIKPGTIKICYLSSSEKTSRSPLQYGNIANFV